MENRQEDTGFFRINQMMQTLIEMLAIERAGDNLFKGMAPKRTEPRFFGGAAVAQALLAAYETAGSMTCHSLHAYFIHPGDAAAPMLYQVQRLRDGASFATRIVTALQAERPVLSMTASFQAPAEGLEHQIAPPSHGAEPHGLTDDDTRGQYA